MKNKVIVFDLDGTLLDSENQIIGGDQTLKYLNLLQTMGCTLAICTGRLDHDILKVQQKYQLSIQHRISQNGAVVIKENYLCSELLNKSDAFKIYDQIKKYPVRIEINTVSNRYWTSERDPEFPKELYDSHMIKQDFEEIILCQPVVLFLIVGQTSILEDIAKTVNKQYKRIQAILTSATSLEILSCQASKGLALKNNFQNDYIYAIGDSPSDFAMIEYSDYFYNVGQFENPKQAIVKPSILEALTDIYEKERNI